MEDVAISGGCCNNETKRPNYDRMSHVASFEFSPVSRMLSRSACASIASLKRSSSSCVPAELRRRLRTRWCLCGTVRRETGMSAEGLSERSGRLA